MEKTEELFKIILPKLIFVLGMHRSGTSLVAQLISKWGAFMGDDLMAADKYNKDGYWEYNPLIILNDKILSFCKSSWDNPPIALDVELLLNVFGKEARNLVERMDQNHEVWCWKDPRIIFLLPFWKEILKGRDITYVIASRNPLEIADSLYNRDKIPTVVSLAVWECTYIRIFQEIENQNNYLIIEYEKLLNDPFSLVSGLMSFLNKKVGLTKKNAPISEILKAIKPDLKKSVKNKELILSSFQEKFYQILISGETHVDNCSYINDLQFFKGITDLYTLTQIFYEKDNYAQLFWATEGEEFKEENSIINNLTEENSIIKFKINPDINISKIRLDPLNKWVILKCKKIEIYKRDKYISEITEFNSNAFLKEDDILYFNTNDPQIIFDVNSGRTLHFDTVVAILEYISKGMVAKSFLTEKFNNDISDLSSIISHKDTLLRENEVFLKKMEDEIIPLRQMILDNESIIKEVKQNLLVKDEVISSLQEQILRFQRENRIYKNSFQYRISDFFVRTPFLFKISYHLYKLMEKKRISNSVKIIKDSLLFDSQYYLSENEDVAKSGMNPAMHFLLFGGYEYRNPCKKFDTSFYLNNNKDVMGSGINPLLHYILHGEKEGREISPVKH